MVKMVQDLPTDSNTIFYIFTSALTKLSDVRTNKDKTKPDSKIAVQRHIGPLSACTMTISGMIGCGIFITPVSVLRYSGSTGAALVIWLVNGVYAFIGALCYIELGTTFPKSGSDFHYLQKIWGELPAFLLMWKGLVISAPSFNVVLSLTFANYILAPFFPHCEIPQSASRLLAATAICKSFNIFFYVFEGDLKPIL